MPAGRGNTSMLLWYKCLLLRDRSEMSRRGMAIRGLLVAALALAGASVGVQARSIAFLTTDTLTSTTRTLSGAKSIITNEFADATFLNLKLDPDPGVQQRQIAELRQAKPDIIVTIGSGATEIATRQLNNQPIVFSSVMYPVVSGFVKSLNHPGENITGASLTIPVDIQFKYFKQILPTLKILGVLYTSNTASLIPPSQVVAQQMGLKLVAVRVDNERELPKALDSLTTVVDGIWSVADPNLFNPQATKYILLNTMRKGVPFMGFSRHVVESGALFALDFDYKAIGRQAGEIAVKILGGTKPGEIPVTSPDIIWFHYNEKTAKHINVAIPAELSAVAKEVYR